MRVSLKLAANNISKSFGVTLALDDVSITFESGEVRALVGENGAGKSTLLKVISGAISKDSGQMFIDGGPFNPVGLQGAQASGVALVFQEISINPAITIAENIFINRLRNFKGFGGFLDWKKLRQAAQQILDDIGANISVTQNLLGLDLGQWKTIEIARAVAYNPKFLFLDESTAFLNTQEVNAFLKVIRNLKEKGIAIGFVSHHLDEVGKVADQITILKDGNWVGDYSVNEIKTEEIETLMVGREISKYIYPPRRSRPKSAPSLSLKSAGVVGKMKNVSLDLYPGEILGIGGLKGSGGETILEAILGDIHLTEGTMYFEGQEFKPRNPSDAWKLRIAHLPGDRAGEGLILDFTVLENVTLSVIPRKGAFLDKPAALKMSEKAIAELRIKADSPYAPSSSLSGGNLQKVVLGKCMAPNPCVMLLNNPTRGIDVGARIEIYRIIRQLADTGTAVILLSEDLLELIGFSDRILITRTGEISKEFTFEDHPTEEEAISYMI